MLEHFGLLTCFHNSIDEILARDSSLVVFVHFTEQIRNARLLVIHELHELKFLKWIWLIPRKSFTFIQITYSTAPIVPAEVLNLLQFLEIGQFILQAALTIPSHHPDVTPFVPKLASSWVPRHNFTSTNLAARQSNKMNVKRLFTELDADLWRHLVGKQDGDVALDTEQN